MRPRVVPITQETSKRVTRRVLPLAATIAATAATAAITAATAAITAATTATATAAAAATAATATATTEATTAAAAAAEATTAAALTSLFGFVHAKGTAVEHGTVELRDGFLRAFGGAHLNEREAARAAGLAIDHELHFRNFAAFGERL